MGWEDWNWDEDPLESEPQNKPEPEIPDWLRQGLLSKMAEAANQIQATQRVTTAQDQVEQAKQALSSATTLAEANQAEAARRVGEARLAVAAREDISRQSGLQGLSDEEITSRLRAASQEAEASQERYLAARANPRLIHQRQAAEDDLLAATSRVVALEEEARLRSEQRSLRALIDLSKH